MVLGQLASHIKKWNKSLIPLHLQNCVIDYSLWLYSCGKQWGFFFSACCFLDYFLMNCSACDCEANRIHVMAKILKEKMRKEKNEWWRWTGRRARWEGWLCIIRLLNLYCGIHGTGSPYKINKYKNKWILKIMNVQI